MANGLGGYFSQLATRLGDAPAVTCGRTSLTFSDLDVATNRLARVLGQRGVSAGDFVAILRPNGVDVVATSLAAWKLGACPLPLNPRMAPGELSGLLDLARPAAVVDEPIDASGALPDPLPDVATSPWKAIGSGGSTGRPKIIVEERGDPDLLVDRFRTGMAMEPGLTHLVAGPQYFNAPFLYSSMHLLNGAHLVIMQRFDPASFLSAIAEHQVGWTFVVPTMLHRIVRLPASTLATFDPSPLRTLVHGGGPCPVWLKREVIALVGAERVFELYGATEGGMRTFIRGDEWLERPGTVGKPPPPAGVRILDPDTGDELAPGEVGEVWIKPLPGFSFHYLGADVVRRDGHITVGDLGRVDADGYLFIADRTADLIVSGGVNVYPAEVEGALLSHPDVRDAAVVGVDDDEWGQRVHAVIEADPATDLAALDRHCRSLLSAHKIPRTWEITGSLGRTEAGKLRRSAIRRRVSPVVTASRPGSGRPSAP